MDMTTEAKIKKYKNQCKSNYGFSWQELQKIKKFEDLVPLIPNEMFSTLAMWLMIYWISSPIVMMFFNLFFDQKDEISAHLQMLPVNSSFWYMMLQHTGFLGCLLGLLAGLKWFYDTTTGSSKKISYSYLKQAVKQKPYVFLLLGFLLSAFVSTIFSIDPNLSIFGSSYRQEGLITFLAYTGVFLLGYLINQRDQMDIVIQWFVLTAMIQACLVLTNNAIIYQVLNLTKESGVFYNQNHYGYYLCLALMSAVILLLSQDKKSFTCFLTYVSIFILTYALIANKSFGPYMAVFLGYGSLVLLLAWRHRNTLIYVIFCIIILLMCSFNFSTNIKTDVITMGRDITAIVHAPEDASTAGSARWILWQHGFQFIVASPIVGHGLETIGILFESAGIQQDRIHNTFLHIAATIGIPGLICYLSSLLGMAIHFFKHKMNQTLLLCGLFSLILTYLISSSVGNSMFYTSPFFIFFLGLGQGELDRDSL